MTATIQKSIVNGKVDAISSKSYCHRHILAAALSDREVVLLGVGESVDIVTTIELVSALGVRIKRDGDKLTITPPNSNVNIDRGNIGESSMATSNGNKINNDVYASDSGVSAHNGKYNKLAINICSGTAINCRYNNEIDVNMHESGSTLRFALPILASLAVKANITGEGRLPDRTIEPIVTLLEQHGISLCGRKLPLQIQGKLTSGRYETVGNISSQFISGLLMALPLLDGDSEIVITTQLESRQYVNMTIEVLARYGIIINATASGYSIAGGQRYSPNGAMEIERDWSNASVWLALGAVVGNITIAGLNINSAQGDRAILDILLAMRANLEIGGDEIKCNVAELQATNCSVRDCPDLAPMIAFAMSFACGESRIYDTERLVIKESDRRTAIIDTLTRVGVKCHYDSGDGSIVIVGINTRAATADSGHDCQGSTAVAVGNIGNTNAAKAAKGIKFGESIVLNGYNDHRIVMLASAFGVTCGARVSVTGSEAVNKSYREFYEILRRIGGDVEIRK